MKSFLFIILVGYAACSDESFEDYDITTSGPKVPFKVYWNIPTFQCASKKIFFNNLYDRFGIIQNDNHNDAYQGDKIAILYEPGSMPYILVNKITHEVTYGNGGLPHYGNLEEHLAAFRKDLDILIPDKNFSGRAIIDFEKWRPVFRQNFGNYEIQKNLSCLVEKQLHREWKKNSVEAEAKRRFDEAAEVFMKTTITEAKQLRPNARWGYYAYPYCFNMREDMKEECSDLVQKENDQIQWLWSESTALYPSVYSSKKFNTSQLVSLIRGQINEAHRCATPGTEILPYFSVLYKENVFFTETDLKMALYTFYQCNATGVILWGSSNDVNTPEKCENLLEYIENVFGPAIAKYTKPANEVTEENDVTYNATFSINKNVSTENPIFNEISKFNLTIDTDHGSYWNLLNELQGNFTQNVHERIGEQINNTLTQKITPDNGKDVLQNNSVLTDLLPNDNVDITSTPSAYSNDKVEKKGVNNNVDSITSSTESHTSTETNQLTITVVPNNFLTDEANNTTTQVQLNIEDDKSLESTTLDLTTSSEYNKTYKQTEAQTADIIANETSLELATTTEFVTMIASTKSDTDQTSTFGSEFTTISTTDASVTNMSTKQSKNDNEEQIKKPTNNDLIYTETTTTAFTANNDLAVNEIET